MPRSISDSEPKLDAAKAEIARTRERLAESLGTLKTELGTLADARTWIARHPLPFLAAAFGLGLWMGTRGSSGSRRR